MLNNMEKNIKKKLEEIELAKKLFYLEQDLDSLKSNSTRGRSITAGTAFGGLAEIVVRGDGDKRLWVILNPSEVIEFIHQLSGIVGCHINIQPREDFASWRGWKRSEDEKKLEWGGSYGGPNHPPHPVIQDEAKIGISYQESILTEQLTGEQNETLAITKTVNKRKSKRTTTPT